MPISNPVLNLLRLKALSDTERVDLLQIILYFMNSSTSLLYKHQVSLQMYRVFLNMISRDWTDNTYAAYAHQLEFPRPNLLKLLKEASDPNCDRYNELKKSSFNLKLLREILL